MNDMRLGLGGSLLAAMLWACEGCGGPAPAGSAAGDSLPGNSFTISRDGYGLQNPTFLSSSVTGDLTLLRADIAGAATDGWKTRNVLCITVDTGSASAGRFGIGGGDLPRFPGSIYIFDGHETSWLAMVSGTVVLEEWGRGAGEVVAGSFDIVVEDRNPDIAGLRSYPVAGSFRFLLGSAASVVPLPDPYPPEAAPLFASKCSGCHRLGDAGAVGGVSLSRKGVLVPETFAAGEHHGERLTADEEGKLTIYLNGE